MYLHYGSVLLTVLSPYCTVIPPACVYLHLYVCVCVCVWEGGGSGQYFGYSRVLPQYPILITRHFFSQCNYEKICGQISSKTAFLKDYEKQTNVEL